MRVRAKLHCEKYTLFGQYLCSDLFSWRPEIAAAWKHCSRTGDKFCDSIFRYLSDSFETSLTHQLSELTQRQLMGLISLAHGRADSRRRVGKANGWNRSGFPSFARSMQARAAGFFSGRGCYLAFPCIFPIGFWIDVRLLEKNCFCLITHGILYFVLVCIDSIFSCNLISAFLSLHSHPFTNPCSIAGRAGFIALRHRCAKIQQMQRSTWAQGRRSRTVLPQDLQSTVGSACALSFPPRQQVSTCIDKSGTVKIEDLNIYFLYSYY